MHVFSSLFRTKHIPIRYKVELISGNILCWVKKPDYKSIRKKLIKSKYIDDNTGFMIISKDIFTSRSDNTIMIIFQDFKQIFNIDNIFSLKELELTRNLDKLELLSQLGCLTKLDLGYNNLTIIPSEIGKLTSLTKLYLYYNKLTNLPSEIGKLINLTELNLGVNYLTNLPSEIGNLTNLDRLSLSCNQLTNIPSEIGNLTSLTKLYLYCNQLTNIPSEISNLIKLTDLSLYHNQLTNLPSEIGNLTKLTKFIFK